MHRHSLRNLVVTALLTLAACGAPPQEAQVGQAIEGGSADSGDAPVGLVWRSDEYDTCTGTVIAPKFVLTAAHCMEGASAGSVLFYTGSGSAGHVNSATSYNPAQDATLTAHAVAAIMVAPGFVDNCPNQNDAALLLLATPIFGGASTIAPAGAALPATNSSVTAVGFGIHTLGNVDYIGQKIVASENVVAVNPSNIKVDWDKAANGLAYKGDSGGPIYYANTIIGTLMCSDAAGNDYYQRIDQLAGWIDSTIQSWDQACYSQCESSYTACGSTCACLRGYDGCMTRSCGDFIPITFFCPPSLPGL